MPSITKKRAKKAGLPAESLVYTGDLKGGAVKIAVMDYDDQQVAEQELTSVDQCIPYRDKPTVTWVNVEGVHDARVLEKLGECFGLHRLVIEDIMSTDQRPKTEDFGDYIYVVLKMLSPDPKDGTVVSEQISLILGPNFVLSFQEGIEGDVFSSIRERIRTGKGKIRKMGADYLAYALLDAIVDNYFIVLEKFGEKVDLAEDQLIAEPTESTAKKIYGLKRDLLLLHRAIWPVRELAGALTRREPALIRDATVPYLRDVYDHVVQAIDTVEIFREILSEMIGIYLSSVSNKLNAIMKVLTIIATIFMPLTFIAGVYGMNFKYMPELEWRYGYYFIWLIMASIGVGMFFYFRRKKWM
jgi:magnesium transporter